MLDRKKRVPFYEQCAAGVLKAIEDGRYAMGEFLPSERDLSRQFGVNRLTLRKGLADLVRRGILESVPGAGNRVVGKGRVSAKSRLIGCVMNRQPGVRTLSPYYADVFSGIEAALAESDYSLVFSSVRVADLWTAAGAVRVRPQAVNPRCAGVLLIGGLPDELAQLYLKKGAGVVFVDRIGGNDVPSVVPDNAAGALAVARYLVGLGHRRIAFLGARKDPVVEARLSGLTLALKEAGRSFDNRDFIAGDYEIRPAFEAMKAYLARNRRSLPTAVLAVNDEAAIGALRAVREAGLRVPRDMSVAGFDDIAWAAHAVPPLTTVRIPREEMGRMAARTLLARIEGGPAAPALTAIPTELMVRDSCAAAPSRRAAKKSLPPAR